MMLGAYRFVVKRRLEVGISCDGEPVPDLVVPLIRLVEDEPGARPKGERPAGEVLVGDPDRFWADCDREPMVRCSFGRDVDIIDYFTRFSRPNSS